MKQMNELFTYDDLNQLLTASGSWQLLTSNGSGQTNGAWQQSFTYDATGNIMTNSQVGTYTYAPQSSGCPVTDGHNGMDPPQAVKQAGTQTYCYDANGSLTMVNDSATQQQETLTWNDDNLLASITMATTTKKKTGSTMTYDTSGERVAETTKIYDASGKRVDKTAKNYYFGSLLEYSSTRGLIKYYYAGSILVAQKDATGTYWYHQDQLGSTRLMTNKQGGVVAQYDYTAFGQSMQESGSQQNDIGYTGQRLDAESGLLYLHGRYYDPQIARFISPDPIVSDIQNPQALNAYSYVYNNPISNVDPTGFSTNDDPGQQLEQDGGVEDFGKTSLSEYQSEVDGLDVRNPEPPNTVNSEPPTEITFEEHVDKPTIILGEFLNALPPDLPDVALNNSPATQYPAILNGVTPQSPQQQSQAGSSFSGTIGVFKQTLAGYFSAQYEGFLQGFTILASNLWSNLSGAYSAVEDLFAPSMINGVSSCVCAPPGSQVPGSKATIEQQSMNLQMSGRPGNNTAQNAQFKAAVRQYQRETGVQLTDDQIRQVHDAIGKEGYGPDYGFQDIINDLYGRFGNGK